MTVELQNVTSTCHHVRVIPPSTSAFAIGPGKGLFTAFKMSAHKIPPFSA